MRHQLDHRLVLCGYPRRILLVAKVTALAVATRAVTGYATLVLLLFFRPESILIVYLGLASTGIAYGALGFLLSVLVRGELEGFFVIMVSLIDTFMQKPVGNPLANNDTSLISSFGATQAYVAGGFTHVVPWDYLGVALIWPLGFIGLGMLIFAHRTRVPRARPVLLAPTPQPAAR